jgi:hypothetical protein
MPTEPFDGAGRKAAAGPLTLEIGLQPGEVPLRIPVALQNLTTGLLTLRVTQTLNWVEWERLSGHDSHLRLPGTGSGEAGAIPGKLSWIKQSGPAGASVFLGMEITQPTPQVYKLLEDQVLHTPKDIKDLWQQWDRFQVKTRRSAVMGTSILLLGVILLALGVGILTATDRFPYSYGYGSLAVGGLLTLIVGVRFWWQRRV